MTENQNRAIKHLSVIKEINEANKSLQLEIEALRYQAEGVGAIRYDKDTVQTSPQNYMEIALIDAAQKVLELEESLAQIDEMKTEAYHIVKLMGNEDERTFIINHYLNCISIQDLIILMAMSERKLYYLKDDALETYGCVMKDLDNK